MKKQMEIYPTIKNKFNKKQAKLGHRLFDFTIIWFHSHILISA